MFGKQSYVHIHPNRVTGVGNYFHIALEQVNVSTYQHLSFCPEEARASCDKSLTNMNSYHKRVYQKLSTSLILYFHDKKQTKT